MTETRVIPADLEDIDWSLPCEWVEGCPRPSTWAGVTTCECRTTRLVCDGHHDYMVRGLRSTTKSSCCFKCGTRRIDADMVTWRRIA